LDGTKFFPRRLSFPKICDILVAYLNVGADKEYVGVSEVVSKSNVTLHNISRNNNFFKGWGFIEENEKEPGKYRMSREAAEFAYAYRIDPNGDLTREMLEKMLSKHDVLAKFVDRIKRENLSRDVVLVELPRVIGDLRADKVGLSAFLEMIAYAFQIEEISVPTRPIKPVRELGRSVKPSREAQRLMPKVEVPFPRASISINLTISPEVSPERLKEYVKAMLEAYDEYSQSK
jgi:hypothetical protein